jgi:hypothetical protein
MLDLDQVSDQAPPAMGKTVYLLRKLKDAGEPITISVNGRGNLVVADDGSYGMLLDLVDRLELIEVLKQNKKELDDGKGLSLEEVKEQAKNKYGYSL